jgi:hypothetical protein
MPSSLSLRISRGKVGFKETVTVSAPGMPGGIYWDLGLNLSRKHHYNRMLLITPQKYYFFGNIDEIFRSQEI